MPVAHSPEANYSVIQRECLAIVWAMKQFRHYLLGRTFQLMTDHAPLQWLAVQKMEGLLCRWALAIQEFSFETVYRKGIANENADALSRREPEMETPHAAMTTVYAGFTPEELKKAQKQDDAFQQLYTACTQLATNPTQKLEATTNEMICPVMVTTGGSRWHCLQKIQARSHI